MIRLQSTATKEIKSSQSKPHTEVPSSSQSSSGTSQPSTSSSEKKIRLATSDGRQVRNKCPDAKNLHLALANRKGCDQPSQKRRSFFF